MADYKCQDCGFTGDYEVFPAAENLHERMVVGDTWTDSECPECGALAFPVNRTPKDSDWLIWSNEHSAWWKPARQGYTIKYSEAGRYSFEEAIAICKDGGFRRSSFSHHDIKVPNECMLLAPDEKVSAMPKPLTPTLKKETL